MPLPIEKTSSSLGISFMVAGVFLFAMNDVVGKWLVSSYGLGQVILIRSLAALAVLVPLLIRQAPALLRATQKPGLQVARALLSASEVALFYAAVIFLPLADAITFYLAGPIYVAILGAMLLGERSDPIRWIAVAGGFAGVLVALEPTSASFSAPAGIALLGSLLFAGLMIVTRYLRGTPELILVSASTIAGVVLGLVLLPFTEWRPLTPLDTLAMCGLGLVALVGNLCVNRSLMLAPASTVVPYQYLLIVWALLFGYLVFGDIPRVGMLIGAGLIIAAGIVIFFRERQIDGRDEAMPEPPG